MDTDTKICPQCDAEFYAHINECNGCNVALVSPDALASNGAAAMPEAPAGGDVSTEDLRLVSIEQGDIAKIDELHRALSARGVPSEVINASAAAGSCGGAFLLQVPEYIKETAVAAIDAHWQTLHPELKDAMDREESGECPACGFKLDLTPDSCPDCGLSLGGATEDDDDCSEPTGSGSCGPC